MSYFKNMSLFENLLMLLGFVRVRRVLEGMRVVRNDAERIAAGYEIFGLKYTDVLEHEIVHGNFDPSRISMDLAIVAFRNLADAMLRVLERPEENPLSRTALTEGSVRSAPKKNTGVKPIMPPPGPKTRPSK